jgi:bisphosphoglycerate-dependent phosphoglycerate mutase
MTEYQQLIVIRHGESLTNATNTFRAANKHDTRTVSARWVQIRKSSRRVQNG